MTFKDRLDDLRTRAQRGGLPMRRTDAALYAVLSEIKAICEDITAAKAEDDLRAVYAAKATNRRKYLETGSDVHVIACRYVLEDDDTRNSVYRYAIALREAAKRQIGAQDLAEWLRASGGVNALYKARETAFRVRTTKTLHLTSPVEVVPGVALALTVMRRPDGFFDLVQA